MKTYTVEELKEVLDKHRKHRLGEEGGERANLRGADLSYANLSYANLRGADLRGADLRGADLSYANLRGADLSYADLRGADLGDADLRSANLRYADLSGADLSYANLSGANLSYADLSDANLSDANLGDADLRSANLRYADLSGADLSYANLRGADLSYADLSDANLSDANLSGADLSGANLSYAKNIPDYLQKYFKKDLLYVLIHSPKADIEILREKVINGEIDGTQYAGECACLIGTLYQAEKSENESTFVKSHIPYYQCGLHNASEQLFYQIRKGDKPGSNIFAQWALDVIDEVLAKSTKDSKPLDLENESQQKENG